MRVEFNENDHSYSLGDSMLISVTQLLKKHGLTTDYTGVSDEVLARAAAKGNAVHKEIEEYVKNGNAGFTQELIDFTNICDELGFTPTDSEIILPARDISDDEAANYVCAGRADIIGKTKEGRAIVDVKTTATVNKRACAWQLSIYERLLGEECELYVFHLGKASKVIPIDRIPQTEIDRLFECERNGEIYQEPGLVVTGDLIACAEAAERELKLAEATAKIAKATAERYRQQLYALMTEQGIDSWETIDKSLLITRVAPSTKPTIDSEGLRKDLPEIAKKYTKISNVKGYVRITVREA